MGFYGPHVLLNDGKRHGIPVLPPDVNRSGTDCSIEPLPSLVAEPFQARSAPRLESLGYGGRVQGLAVRIGLRYVRGLSRETALPVEAERRKNGGFRSLFDFLERTHIKREAFENLIACGAFDEFGLERRELLWQLGLIYRSEGRNAEQRQLALALPTGQDMVPLRPMTDWDRMAADYSTLGMSPAYHPMSFLRSGLHEAIVPTRMLGSLPHGASVELAGMVVVRQQPGSAKGFVFLLIEDEFGLANVIVRPDLYEAQRSLVRSAPFVIVHGTLELRDGTTNIAAKHFTELAVPGGLAPDAHNFG
jgi:error-prone DNA polymerase